MRSERGKEKFVQWKDDPVPSKGGIRDFDGPDTSSPVRKNRPTTRQKSLLSSLAASIERPEIEEEDQGTSTPTFDSESGRRTSSHNPADIQNSPVPPRVRPPRQVESTGRRGQNRTSVSDGQTEIAGERVPAVEKCGVPRQHSVLHQTDSPTEEDGTEGSPQRRAPQGKRVYTMNELLL